MICKNCGKDMLRDRVSEDGNVELSYFKCPDPACANYGYRNVKTPEKAGAQSCCGQVIAYITADTYAIPNRTNATARLNRDTGTLTVTCPECSAEHAYNIIGKAKVDS